MKHNQLETLALEQESRKVRIGMVYAAFGAPMLGVAFGFAGLAGTQEPFSQAYPTGPMAFEMFEYMFGLLAVFLYSMFQGTANDHFRIFRSKIAWYGVFVAMTGMTGDFLFFSSAAIVGGAIAGPVASLFGFWGAVITSLIYREKILNNWTVIGVIFIVVGLWIASGGVGAAVPTGVSMTTVVVGAGMGILASLLFGFENFAIAAGSDLIPEESTLFWRTGWALLGLIVINLFIMPKFTPIGYQMFTTPSWWAYAALTGGAWGLYMIVSLYIGISTSGSVGGGLLASTGFVWTTFLSMTVYGKHWSPLILVGTLVLFGGVALMLLRPSKIIAQLRS